MSTSRVVSHAVVHAFPSIGITAARVLGVIGALATGAVLSLAGCATATAPQLTLTFAAPPPDYTEAIARAREARDRATAIPAPSPTDLAAASDETISDALKSWAVARREAAQAANRAYTDALRTAPGPTEEAEVYGELADVWLRLEEDTRSALFAATPAGYREDPALVGAVQGAADYALRPLLDRVESHLHACERVLQDSPSAAAKTCGVVALRLKEARDPRAPSAARGIVASAAERPIVPTTHPKPCTFKGTLSTRGAIYESESGTSMVLPLERGQSIEVESLAVASSPGGRYKVTVSWPKALEGYLDAEEGPFVLTRTVEVEPGAVWAAQGERVAASDTRGATVLAARPKVRGDATPSRPARNLADRRLFCHDLELATPQHAGTRVGP